MYCVDLGSRFLTSIRQCFSNCGHYPSLSPWRIFGRIMRTLLQGGPSHGLDVTIWFATCYDRLVILYHLYGFHWKGTVLLAPQRCPTANEWWTVESRNRNPGRKWMENKFCLGILQSALRKMWRSFFFESFGHLSDHTWWNKSTKNIQKRL